MPNPDQPTFIAAREIQLSLCLRTLCAPDLGEPDVRMLLVELRPFIDHPTIKQIAHCVAHPDGITQGALFENLRNAWTHVNLLQGTSQPRWHAIPHRIPKALFAHILRELDSGCDDAVERKARTEVKSRLSQLYREHSDYYRLHKKKNEPEALVLLNRAMPGFHTKDGISQAEFIAGLQDAVQKSGLINAQGWSTLIGLVANEITLIVATILNRTPLRIGDGKEVSFQLSDEDGLLSVCAAVDLPINNNRVSLPLLMTDLVVNDYAKGGLLLAGTNGNVSQDFVAVRSPDGSLRLVNGIWIRMQAAVMGDAIEQAVKSGRSKAAVLESMRNIRVREEIDRETGTSHIIYESPDISWDLNVRRQDGPIQDGD
jgi:hypothetical protein